MSEEDDQVHRHIAGFIVWLAGRRLDVDYRHHCPVVAERFLRWQARRRRQQLPSTLNAYCRELSLCGARDWELNDTRRVIEDLERFLGTTS